MTRLVACPIALHPDGAPLRLPVFRHPKAGVQLVKGGIRAEEAPAAAAARELFEESGLETRSALLLGQSTEIAPGELWHFSLCRVVPPVRDRWAHFCADDGGHRFEFHWHDISTPLPAPCHETFENALTCIRGLI